MPQQSPFPNRYQVYERVEAMKQEQLIEIDSVVKAKSYMFCTFINCFAHLRSYMLVCFAALMSVYVL